MNKYWKLVLFFVLLPLSLVVIFIVFYLVNPFYIFKPYQYDVKAKVSNLEDITKILKSHGLKDDVGKWTTFFDAVSYPKVTQYNFEYFKNLEMGHIGNLEFTTNDSFEDVKNFYKNKLLYSHIDEDTETSWVVGLSLFKNDGGGLSVRKSGSTIDVGASHGFGPNE